MYKTSIVVRTQFSGIHCWQNCPLEHVAFLKNSHRHIFFVEIELPVSHDDRDLEFFMVKRSLDETIQHLYPCVYGLAMLGSKSCEMIAKDIIEDMTRLSEDIHVMRCSVFEDKENGSNVDWIKS